MSMWWRRSKEREQLVQRIAELERELHQRSSGDAPAMLTALAEMTVKQAEASSKLLGSVMEATATQAARALGRRRAASGPRDGQGRFVRGTGNGAVKGRADCVFCRDPFHYPFTIEERDFHLTHSNGGDNGAHVQR